MKTLLVATDGSKNALRALHFALDLADEISAHVRLLYVQPKINSTPLIAQSVIDEHYERQTKLAFADALRLVSKRRVKARTEMVLGDPATTIIAYARKYRCSQIVIGNRGHGTLKGFLVGSVALKVIYLAGVPVTLVK
ncbi:MAG: universal stress protein [Steroidobacteraceae bacterium]